MNDRKLIAEALLEIAKKSTTEFIEDSKVDKELVEAAKKIGIIIPSPDLSIFKTTYCEIDKVNLNGVILPKKAVEAGLPTLIGKNCNWEHEGMGQICGYTIDAQIKDDKIETINVIFKSLFPDQAEELKEKVKSGEAAVSFEIWNIDPETKKSVVKDLDNGFKEISPITFHGTGVLLVHSPACPAAKIFKLIAKNLATEAEEFINNVFDKNLVYAQLAIENNEKEDKIVEEVKEKVEEAAYECECLKCGKVISSEQHCKDIKCPECGGEMRRKDRPGTGKGEEEKAEEKLPEETKTEVKAEETKTAEATEKVAEPVVETKSEETKVEETKEAPKAEAEVKVEEPKVEEKAEEVKEIVEEKKEEAQPLEVIEPKIIIKVTRIFSEVTIDTYIDGTSSGTSEVKGLHKTITEYKDGTKDETEEEVEIKRKYDFAEVEEKINSAKAEKDIEIKKLQEELGKKDQEIADLKNPKPEDKKEKELTVGEVTPEKTSEINRRAQEINEIIANKKK